MCAKDESSKDIIEEFFDPELLRHKLLMCSLFIAVFENFKSSIIENVKSFYWSGYEDGKDQYRDYERKVLNKVKSKKNRQIKATLEWFIQGEAITRNDIAFFAELTDIRNDLVHNMAEKVFSGLPEDIHEKYSEMIHLFEKITRWWVYEIELPLRDDFTSEQYENIVYDEITSLTLEYLKAMADIALFENDEYSKIYNQMRTKENKE